MLLELSQHIILKSITYTFYFESMITFVILYLFCFLNNREVKPHEREKLITILSENIHWHQQQNIKEKDYIFLRSFGIFKCLFILYIIQVLKKYCLSQDNKVVSSKSNTPFSGQQCVISRISPFIRNGGPVHILNSI